MLLTRLHSILMASRVHSRVNPASSIFSPCKAPSFIPNKLSTLPSNPVTSIYSGFMTATANFRFSSSRSSFRLSSKGFEPTYEVFARRMFSVNAKPMPEEVDLSHSPAAAPKKKATRSRKKEKSLKDNPEEAVKTKTMPEEIGLSHSPGAAPKKKATRSWKNEVDLSHLTAPAPKKKATTFKEEEKSVKTRDTISAALPKPHEPSTSKLPQQPKPPTVNGIKSIKLKPLYPPLGKSVVVVESPTKAEVIQRYLGDMYQVLPSYGHVRDLAGRRGSVRPDDEFSMFWEVPSHTWTHLKSIKVALHGADNLILALDPDREGEAIAWHIIEMLQQEDAVHKEVTVARVTFQEITESAVKLALESPRDIDVNLVHAYLARRALDYLIGFNLSPLLWRKLPGCHCAGRVQSAALALICDREMEIEEFKPTEYWSIEAIFSSKETSMSSNCLVRSYLTHLSLTKLNQFSIGSQTEAKSIEQIVMASNFSVSGVKRIKVEKKPSHSLYNIDTSTRCC